MAFSIPLLRGAYVTHGFKPYPVTIETDVFLPDAILAAIDGGSFWYCIIVYANSADYPAAWPEDHYAFSTIPGTGSGWTGLNLQEGRLIDISDIDLKGNPYKNALAVLNNWNFKIENLTGYFDNLLSSNISFIGRKVKLILGTGNTIEEPTQLTSSKSIVLCSGNIESYKQSNKMQITFNINGLDSLRNKELGILTDEYADTKDRGNIIPIVYGNHTDIDAYIPVILLSRRVDLPQIQIDNKKLLQMDSLQVWDDTRKISYSIDGIETAFIFNSDKNITSVLTEDTILSASATSTQTFITVNDYSGIAAAFQESGAGSSPSEPVLIKIEYNDEPGEEWLLVHEKPTSTTVIVERGVKGTWNKRKAYNSGRRVYLAARDYSKAYLKLANTFYPSLAAGFQEIDVIGSGSVTRNGRQNTKRINEPDFFGAYDVIEAILPAAIGSQRKLRYVFDVTFAPAGIKGVIENIFFISTQSWDILPGAGTLTGKIFINDDGTDQTLRTAAATFPAVNSGSADLEAAISGISEIENLQDAKYTIIYEFDFPAGARGTIRFGMVNFRFNIEFNVPLVENDIYMRGKGRICPDNSYYTIAQDVLFENPVTILEDIFRREINLTDTYLNQDKFVAAEDKRDAWELALTVSGRRTQAREIINTICINSGLLQSERGDGKISLTTNFWENSSLEITDKDILYNNDGLPDITPGELSINDRITGLNIKYKKNICDNNRWAALKYCDYTGNHNLLAADYQDYIDILENTYNDIDEERPLTLEMPYIRHEGTAELLLKNIIKSRGRALKWIDIVTTYSSLRFWIWSKVKLNAPSIQTIYNERIYLITAWRFIPSINNRQPTIKLSLLELQE